MDQLAQHIESLVFISDNPISFKEIKACLEETFETKFKKPSLEEAIDLLKEKYQEEHYSFEFIEIAGGFQFLSKPSYHGTIATYLKQTTKKRLSRAALETLSIIAYKQPVTKSEMEKIRGVSCDYSVQKLLEKELIQCIGRSEGPGRALLYGSSDKFMDYFGLKSLEDMPKPKDFRAPDSEIGEQAPIDELAEAAPLADVPTSSEDAPENRETIVPEEGMEVIESLEIVEDISTEEVVDTEEIVEDISEIEEEDLEVIEKQEEEISEITEDIATKEMIEEVVDKEEIAKEISETEEGN